MKHVILITLIACACMSCQEKELADQFGDILVQIDAKKLYSSEIENMIHDNVSEYDSVAIANAYIDNWVKDQLLIREAEKYMSSDFEIEALVDDYRSKMKRLQL